jgi:hypothetical protein
LNQLFDRYLTVLDVDVATKRGYTEKLALHVRPFVGSMPAGRLGVEELESLYAEAAKCRDHCRGKKYIAHNKRRQDVHECSEQCRPHVCKGLSAASIRQIHWVISGALAAGVRLKWISMNYADQAKKPEPPKPNPKPPSAADAARLVTAAWESDPDWGAYVWVAMTTGECRSEQCAIRISDPPPRQ